MDWEEIFFESCKESISRNDASPEDQRIADWRFLLPLSSLSESLIIGTGLGTVPIALTRMCQKVYAVDSSNKKISFLSLRKEQQSLNNLYPLCISDLGELSFPPQSFDLISIQPEREKDLTQERPLTQVIDFLKRLLKPNGILHLTVPNSLSPNAVFRRMKSASHWTQQTYFYYRKILKEHGFSFVEVYAPLPHFDRTPLFYLPLNSPEIMNFFLNQVLPLIEMVSPESKRAYAKEYRLAKFGLSAVRRFKLARLIPYFVSGYCLLARRN